MSIDGDLVARSEASELDIFSQDLKWLSDNLDNLRPKYENKYILVKDSRIVLSNANYDYLLDEAIGKHIDVSKAVIERILPKNIQLLL